jgi:pimeloyl-ACP methyl ester carboxylesterase
MIRERTVETRDGSVRCLEAGAGWPLVLLHAFPLSADMWRPQLDRPPEGARLIAPDLNGFGPAPVAPARSLEDMARLVTGLLDALEIERATIGGLSMGGYLTLTLFRLAPERFSAMILANTRAKADDDEGRAGRDRMSALVRKEGPPAVAAQMLPKLLGRTTQEANPDLAVHVRRLIESNSIDGIDAAIQAMKDRPDSTPLLPTVGRPALVVAGEEDTLIPQADVDDLARLLPRAQQVTIPRAGHLSNLEAPADFNEALGNFLLANI